MEWHQALRAGVVGEGATGQQQCQHPSAVGTRSPRTCSEERGAVGLLLLAGGNRPELAAEAGGWGWVPWDLLPFWLCIRWASTQCDYHESYMRFEGRGSWMEGTRSRSAVGGWFQSFRDLCIALPGWLTFCLKCLSYKMGTVEAWDHSFTRGGLVFCVVFSSVQSLSHVWLSATPRTVAYQASLSITNSWSLLKLMSIESVMPSNHLILCHPLLLLPSVFPSLRVFFNQLALCIRWPKYQSFSISPNECSRLMSFGIDWLDLLAVQESSPAPKFKSINSSVLSLLYSPTLTSIYDY